MRVYFSPALRSLKVNLLGATAPAELLAAMISAGLPAPNESGPVVMTGVPDPEVGCYVFDVAGAYWAAGFQVVEDRMSMLTVLPLLLIEESEVPDAMA